MGSDLIGKQLGMNIPISGIPYLYLKSDSSSSVGNVDSSLQQSAVSISSSNGIKQSVVNGSQSSENTSVGGCISLTNVAVSSSNQGLLRQDGIKKTW